MKRLIPINLNRHWLDYILSGKEPLTKDQPAIMWWFQLSQEEKEYIKIEREAEKQADKYSKWFTNTFLIILLILGVYIGRNVFTSTLAILLLAIGVMIIGIIISALVMYQIRQWVFKKTMKNHGYH